MEWQLYIEWFDWLTQHFSKVTPDKFIYLKANPEISYQRMVNRTRDEETNVPIDYLKQVAEKHDNWLLDEDSNENVITIDVNHDFSDSNRFKTCLLYTSPSPRDRTRSRMPSSA